MKKVITGISIWSITGLTVYLIYLFFQDYYWLYLVTAIIVPILLMFLTSPYYKTNLITFILIAIFGFGAYSLESPFDFIALSCLIYTILFKSVRIFGNLNSKDYFDVFSKQLKGYDLLLLSKLLNSTTLFQNENETRISFDNFKTLFKVQGYTSDVKEVVNSLVEIYSKDFYKTDLTKEKLEELYAFAIYHSYPKMAIRNADGIISVGTQYLLNILNNLHVYNAIDGEKFNEERTIKSIQGIILNSEEKYGTVKREDIAAEMAALKI